MNTVITRPCGRLYFAMDKTNKSIIYVYKREGEVIPDICGRTAEDKEFLVLGIDFNSYEDRVTFSLYTTNQNAVGRHTGEYFQEEELLQIACLDITPEHRGATRYENYALLLEHNVYNKTFSILFYDGLGNHASNLLEIWIEGLLVDRVA